MAESMNGSYSGYKGASKNNTLMGRTGQTSSPLKSTNENLDKKKAIINESVERLSNPQKTAVAPATSKDDDLIFSIKMSKDEYSQYQKMRTEVKTSKTLTTSAKKSNLVNKSRSITPAKKR